MYYKNSIKILNRIYFHKDIKFDKKYVDKYKEFNNQGQKLNEFKEQFLNNLKEISNVGITNDLQDFKKKLSNLSKKSIILEDSICDLTEVLDKESDVILKLNTELNAVTKEIKNINLMISNNIIDIKPVDFEETKNQFSQEHLRLFKFLDDNGHRYSFIKETTYRDLASIFISGDFELYIREIEKGFAFAENYIDLSKLQEFLENDGWDFVNVDTISTEQEDFSKIILK